jgi:hypothetical protein
VVVALLDDEVPKFFVKVVAQVELVGCLQIMLCRLDFALIDKSNGFGTQGGIELMRQKEGSVGPVHGLIEALL